MNLLPAAFAVVAVSWNVTAQTPESAPASKPASAPAEAKAAPPANGNYAAQKPGGVVLDGYVDFRYRFRSTKDEVSDQDILTSLGFDLKLPGVGKKGLNFHFAGSSVWDVNDFPQTGSELNGLSETFDSRFHTYIYEAFAEMDPGGPIATARIGRQMLWREEGIRFDGAYVETRRQGLFTFSVYGGVPVHFYESSARGDVVAGLGVKLHATKTLTFTVDEIYVRDRRNIPGIPDREEDLLSVFGVEWRPSQHFMARGSFSMLDDTERRQNFALSYVDSDNGFRASGEILRQNEFTELPVTEFSPFVTTLGAYSPYLEGRINASKTLFKPVELGGGYRIRRIIEGNGESLYNHEFDHVYGSLTLDPFPVEEFVVSLRGDLYESDDIHSGGGGLSIEKRFGKIARLTASTDYSLYRLDYLTGEERFRSREYALRARVNVTERVSVGAGYRFEIDAFNEYHVADFNLIIRF